MPRRPALKREADLLELSRRYLSGEQQVEIARSMGVSQQQISLDLRTLQARWKKDSTLNLDDRKLIELAKIDNLEREYWLAWENSKKEKEKAKQERRRVGRLNIQITSVSKEMLIGDPRFLEGVLKCIERRCKILGIDAPEKSEVRSDGKLTVEVVYVKRPLGSEGQA